jgi:hypothetical protein
VLVSWVWKRITGGPHTPPPAESEPAAKIVSTRESRDRTDADVHACVPSYGMVLPLNRTPRHPAHDAREYGDYRQ